jgi:hypothetical protein
MGRKLKEARPLRISNDLSGTTRKSGAGEFPVFS